MNSIYFHFDFLDSKIVNAYCSGWFGGKTVVIHEKLLNILPKNETLAVVAHELGHAVYHHNLILLFWNMVATEIDFHNFIFLYNFFLNNFGVKKRYA